MSELLQVDDLKGFYGKAQALFGLSLSLRAGEAVALMGRNGMGKTTTIRAICGMLPHRAGSIRLDGEETIAARPHAIARHGIGLVPEGRRCFPNLTVQENLVVAARPGSWDLDRVIALFPRLGERRNQRAQSLSGGEQQMLAIGRALMTNPRLLILDEATEGLAPVVRQEIWAAIRQLRQQEGLSLLIVDKSIKELKGVADRAVIVEKGKDVWTGAMAALDPAVTTRYLGV